MPVQAVIPTPEQLETAEDTLATAGSRVDEIRMVCEHIRDTYDDEGQANLLGVTLGVTPVFSVEDVGRLFLFASYVEDACGSMVEDAQRIAAGLRSLYEMTNEPNSGDKRDYLAWCERYAARLESEAAEYRQLVLHPSNRGEAGAPGGGGKGGGDDA